MSSIINSQLCFSLRTKNFCTFAEKTNYEDHGSHSKPKMWEFLLLIWFVRWTIYLSPVTLHSRYNKSLHTNVRNNVLLVLLYFWFHGCKFLNAGNKWILLIAKLHRNRVSFDWTKNKHATFTWIKMLFITSDTNFPSYVCLIWYLSEMASFSLILIKFCCFDSPEFVHFNFCISIHPNCDRFKDFPQQTFKFPEHGSLATVLCLPILGWSTKVLFCCCIGLCDKSVAVLLA